MENKVNPDSPFLVVLGIAQDGGIPHAGCTRDCCQKAWLNKRFQRFAACIGIVDPLTNEHWMIDATPDFKWQYYMLKNPGDRLSHPLDGVFLTHGHVGHYTGLIFLEKAMMNTQDIPVYVMPRMMNVLSAHLPWKSLVDNKNILLKPMKDRKKLHLNKRIMVEPFMVPHRDEFSETVGFMITGTRQKVLYIPDIDNWEMFVAIDDWVDQADVIFADGTFFQSSELKGRDPSRVPHPPIDSSMERFVSLPKKKKSKFYFIHLNHTNPCLDKKSDAYKVVLSNGFRIAREGQKILI